MGNIVWRTHKDKWVYIQNSFPHYQYLHYTDSGIATENNAIGKQWICIPVKTSDTYVFLKDNFTIKSAQKYQLILLLIF